MTIQEPVVYVRYPSRTILLQTAWFEADNCELVEMNHGYFILEYPSMAAFVAFKNTILAPALPTDFDQSQIIFSFTLAGIKEVPYVMLYEVAIDVIAEHNNGTIQPRDTIEKIPKVNPGKGGRFWLDGAFTLEQLEALVVIGNRQMTERD